MSELPPIERKRLGEAASDQRMTTDYAFFSSVIMGVLEARGFERLQQASVYYHVDDLVPGYNGNCNPILPMGLDGFFEGNSEISGVRFSLANRYVRGKESLGVLAESVFANLGDYRRRRNFRPVLKSLVGNLGVHSRQVIHSMDLKKYKENGQHIVERVLDTGCIIQTPTRHGDLYILGLAPIQDLSRMVSEKLA